MMSEIGRYIEIKQLAEKAGLMLKYQQGGRFVIQTNAEKTVMSTIDIDIAYGAVVGYLFAKENGIDNDRI